MWQIKLSLSQSLWISVWLRHVCRIQDCGIHEGYHERVETIKIELEFGRVGFSAVVMYLQSPQEGLSIEGQLPACQ